MLNLILLNVKTHTAVNGESASNDINEGCTDCQVFQITPTQGFTQQTNTHALKITADPTYPENGGKELIECHGSLH